MEKDLETKLIELLKTEKKYRKAMKKTCLEVMSGAILSLEDNMFAQKDVISDLIGLNHVYLALRLNKYDELTTVDLDKLSFLSQLTAFKEKLLDSNIQAKAVEFFDLDVKKTAEEILDNFKG